MFKPTPMPVNKMLRVMRRVACSTLMLKSIIIGTMSGVMLPLPNCDMKTKEHVDIMARCFRHWLQTL